MARATAKAPDAPAPDLAPARAAADKLKLASDPTRLAILLALVPGELTVTEIRRHIPASSQPGVSAHLATLRHGRLASPRREHSSVFYGLTDAGRALAKLVSDFMG